MLKLDRAVTSGKIDIISLEESLSSDIMFPHVLATLAGLDMLNGDASAVVTSSTKVGLMH